MAESKVLARLRRTDNDGTSYVVVLTPEGWKSEDDPDMAAFLNLACSWSEYKPWHGWPVPALVLPAQRMYGLEIEYMVEDPVEDPDVSY